MERFIDLMILTDNEKSLTIKVVIVIAFASFPLESGNHFDINIMEFFI